MYWDNFINYWNDAVKALKPPNVNLSPAAYGAYKAKIYHTDKAKKRKRK